MFFEAVSDISQAVELYLAPFKLDNNEGPFSSSLVLPEIIREYEDLVLGSQISIRLSFYLKRNNFDLGPEEVASEIFKFLKSDATREYFIGRNVYVNAKIVPVEVMKYLIQAGANEESPFLSKNRFVKEVITRVLGTENISQRFLPDSSSVFREVNLKPFAEILDGKQKKLVYLASITDPEFEEAHLLKNYPSRDNPVWIFSEFERIIDTYYNVRKEGNELEYFESPIKSSLHTVPASHRALKKAHQDLAYFSSLYDYFLLDALRRSKPEIFWVHIIQLQRSVMSLWNDPWIRMAIEGRSVKGDGGELDEIFRVLRIFRSGIVCLLG